MYRVRITHGSIAIAGAVREHVIRGLLSDGDILAGIVGQGPRNLEARRTPEGGLSDLGPGIAL